MASPSSNSGRPKCFEVAFLAVREAALVALEKVAELRSVLIVMDWEVGQNDFPAGSVVAREGELATAEVLLARQRQLLKVMESQTEQLRQWLTTGEQLVHRLQQKASVAQASSSPSGGPAAPSSQ